jgi:EAL domain-containing protein (putative c-di-GMP-specific phosphodiesterase class I)
MEVDQSATRIQQYLARIARDANDLALSVSSDGRACGRFYRCQITSAFQPILSARPSEPVAVQALVRVRGTGGGDLAPWSVFSLAANDDQLVAFDRRCRVVHTLNFFAHETQGIDLYLSVHDRLIAAVASDHGRAFRDVLEELGFGTNRVVIELPAQREGAESQLAQVIAAYRLNGFRVAINPCSVKQLEEVLGRIRVDAVKVDVRTLMKAARASVLHAAADAGVAIVAKRIDTEAERDQALRVGATHLQGHLFAAPAYWPEPSSLRH